MIIRVTFGNVGMGLGFRWHKETKKECKTIDRTFAKVFHKEIERRRGMVSDSTIENELTAYRSFLTFIGHDLSIGELNPELFLKYERWLLNRGVIPNTSACYMRSLRAVSNRLGIDGKALFLQVRVKKCKAEKKAVDIRTVQKIMRQEPPQGQFMALARDAFLFSIMAMGMPFVDLAHLKKSDCHDGFITYYRRKTGRQVKVRLEPCMREIISHYHDDTTPYLFPLFTEKEPEKAEAQYRRLLGRYNRTLNRLSERCRLNTKLTSYTPRHTWATLAYRKGVVLASISKGLGHASPVTTQNYLKEIDDDGLSEANKRLLIEIFGQI